MNGDIAGDPASMTAAFPPDLWFQPSTEQECSGASGGESCFLVVNNTAPPTMPTLPQAVACDERQNSWESTDFITLDPVRPPASIILSEEAGATDGDHASAAPRRKKARKGGKRRVTAEEKDAKIRARNRRAQQAFRKRQKALAMERSTSLSRLEAEVVVLRNSNKNLQQALQQAQAELAKEKAMNANTARVSQQQDLQMMAVFADAPQLPTGFPPPRFPFDDHFPAFWTPQPDMDLGTFPASTFPPQT